MGIVLAVFVLGMVVALHELGHFLVAKWCKVGVIEYALGFGKSIFTKRWGETKYSLRMIPLGGYVRMAGDDPHSIARMENPKSPEAEDHQVIHNPEEWSHEQPDEIEQKLMADRSKWFLTKPVWAKSAIVVAGPMANLLSAFILAVFTLAVWGATVPLNLPVIGQLVPGYPAMKAGLKLGDKVTSIDGQPIQTWDQLHDAVLNSGGKTLNFHVERSEGVSPAQQIDIPIQGVQEKDDGLDFLENTKGQSGYKIGIAAAGKREQVGFGEAIKIAALHVAKLSELTVKGIAGLAMRKISLKNLGGPIFIFGETMRSANQGIADLFEFIVFLSVSLAVLNLFPIPVLDGGHLLFFLIEAVKGKPVSIRVIELAHQAGMLLLLALTALAVGNDVLRLVHG